MSTRLTLFVEGLTREQYDRLVVAAKEDERGNVFGEGLASEFVGITVRLLAEKHWTDAKRGSIALYDSLIDNQKPSELRFHVHSFSD